MGYYSKTSTDGPVVGNEKSRGEVFPAGDARNAPFRHPKAPVSKAFCAVGSATFAPDAPLYGYRHLSTILGRWPSRDPIEDIASPYSLERLASVRRLLANAHASSLLSQLTPRSFQFAGENTYTFVNNAPPLAVEPLGLSPTDCAPCNAGDTMGTKQKDDWDPNDNDATDGTCTGVPDGIFLPACLTHDACYATCNKPKSECDDAFYDDLYDLCSASCGASFACNLACAWSAQVYYGGVVSFGDSPLAGDQSYSHLQDAACEDCCCD